MLHMSKCQATKSKFIWMPYKNISVIQVSSLKRSPEKWRHKHQGSPFCVENNNTFLSYFINYSIRESFPSSNSLTFKFVLYFCLNTTHLKFIQNLQKKKKLMLHGLLRKHVSAKSKMLFTKFEVKLKGWKAVNEFLSAVFISLAMLAKQRQLFFLLKTLSLV